MSFHWFRDAFLSTTAKCSRNLDKVLRYSRALKCNKDCKITASERFCLEDVLLDGIHLANKLMESPSPQPITSRLNWSAISSPSPSYKIVLVVSKKMRNTSSQRPYFHNSVPMINCNAISGCKSPILLSIIRNISRSPRPSLIWRAYISHFIV